MPDEQTDNPAPGASTGGGGSDQQDDDSGESEFWGKFEGMFDRAFDRWIERENAALEAEEAKQGGKTAKAESDGGNTGVGGDAPGREPSDAERQRDSGRAGRGRYWRWAEKYAYGRRGRD